MQVGNYSKLLTKWQRELDKKKLNHGSKQLSKEEIIEMGN